MIHVHQNSGTNHRNEKKKHGKEEGKKESQTVKKKGKVRFEEYSPEMEDVFITDLCV